MVPREAGQDTLAGLTRPVFLVVSPDWVLPSVLETVLTHYCSVGHSGSEVTYAPLLIPSHQVLASAGPPRVCPAWALSRFGLPGHRPRHSRQTLRSCGPAPMLATARW